METIIVNSKCLNINHQDLSLIMIHSQGKFWLGNLKVGVLLAETELELVLMSHQMGIFQVLMIISHTLDLQCVLMEIKAV